MKKIIGILAAIIIGATAATAARADINEEITFTNFTGEDIYVELGVFDNAGWTYYDLWVLDHNTSIADFWADTVLATYSACAWGELSDQFYGCIEGDVADGFNHVYFDASGLPFLSVPPDIRGADVYVFDAPPPTTDVVVVETDSHIHGHGGGCFIGSL